MSDLPLERSARRRPDWSALFGAPRLADALDEIARRLDPSREIDCIVEGGLPGDEREIAAYRSGTTRPVRHERRFEIRGAPRWTLRVRSRRARFPDAASVESVAALEAWRALREAVRRAEVGLDARTHELALLQRMGRTAAEARTVDELLGRAAAVLHAGGVADAIVAAHALEGCPDLRVFLGRPLAAAGIESLARRVCAEFEWTAEESPEPRLELLDGYDEGRGRREGLREEDAHVVPLRRQGATVGCLAIILSPPADEARSRLVFGATNQVALHLDRLVTVREAEEGRFRSMLDSMPQAVVLTDRRLVWVQANAAADSLLAPASPRSSRRTLGRVGSLDPATLAADVLAGRAPSVAAEARCDDGTILDVTVSAFADGGDRPAGLVWVLADVTESRRLLAQLSQAEKLSSLGQMISGIAHELNNPLASVVGYAQLVSAGTTDEKLARRLQVVHQEAQRCQKIVRNLLGVARRHEPERRLLSVNEVVDTVVGLLAYSFRVDGIRVERDLDRDAPAIHGDPHELQQVLLNLVSNAHHALRDRGQGGTIVVRTRALSPAGVAIGVEDDGPGVPVAIRSRIFDPFFTTKSAGQGTGLGLSLVYGIVRSHGGTIRLDDGPGGGAAFRIELPLGASDGAPLAAEGAEPAPDGFGPGRILVVDDEEPVARMICEALAEDGHVTVSAADGREALDRMATEPFDLVISDLRMPGLALDGLCAGMEQLSAGLSRRLLLTTGDTMSRDAEQLAAHAGLGLLHKPFDLDHLRRTVRLRLSAHAVQRPCDT